MTDDPSFFQQNAIRHIVSLNFNTCRDCVRTFLISVRSDNFGDFFTQNWIITVLIWGLVHGFPSKIAIFIISLLVSKQEWTSPSLWTSSSKISTQRLMELNHRETAAFKWEGNFLRIKWIWIWMICFYLNLSELMEASSCPFINIWFGFLEHFQLKEPLILFFT